MKARLYSLVFILMLAVLSSNVCFAQSASKQPIEFSLNGHTYFEPSNLPPLLLSTTVEELQQDPHTLQVRVNSQREAQRGHEGEKRQTNISANFSFSTYDEFRSWYKSERITSLIEKLYQELETMRISISYRKDRE